MQTDGYEATMRLNVERPDLMPLLRLMFEMGAANFSEGLLELERRGLIERSHPLASDWTPVRAD